MENLIQGSPEWFARRVGKITGSKAGAILGLSKFADADSTLRDMVRSFFKAPPEFTGNVATEYGIEHEPIAIQDFEIEHDLSVDPIGFILSDEYDWVGVSPDGLIGDEYGLEVKCPYSQRIQTLEDMPTYACQCYISLITTKRKGWFYYCWTPNGTYTEVVTYEQALQWWNENKDTLRAFYDRYIAIIADEKLADPYLKPLVHDAGDDAEFSELAMQYDELSQQSKLVAQKLSEVKDKITKLAESYGANKTVGCGLQVIKSVREGSVDYSKIPELAKVDLSKYRKKSSEFWQIREYKGEV